MNLNSVQNSLLIICVYSDGEHTEKEVNVVIQEIIILNDVQTDVNIDKTIN